jgi:hypothetical protein
LYGREQHDAFEDERIESCLFAWIGLNIMLFHKNMQTKDEYDRFLQTTIWRMVKNITQQGRSIGRLPNERDEIRGKRKETLELLQEEETEKIRLRTEKRVHELHVEKAEMRKRSLEKVQIEANEKIRCRTSQRLSELSSETE